jgi:hypothetical protein
MNLSKVFVALVTSMVLAGCDGGNSESGTSSTASESTTATATAVIPAVGISVEAGYGRVAPVGSAIQLNATVSVLQGTTLLWEQVSGTSAPLNDATIEDPSFVVPVVGDSELLVFKLTADDGRSDPVSDTVVVEAWVRAAAASLTAYGDFSGNEGWGCTVDPASESTLTVTENGDQIDYASNGMPAHATGVFPNSGNPNTISEVTSNYSIPAAPVQTNTTTEVLEFGVTLDGVKLERDTAESYQNSGVWRYEAITAGLAAGETTNVSYSWLGTDCNNAHVQPTGSYHYHGLPESIINDQGDAGAETPSMILGGYAADGFPIYLRYGYIDANDATSGLSVMEGSWEVLSGTRGSGPGGSFDGTFREDWQFVSGTGQLDECNGRFGVTPENPEGIYHYYLTDDYPFIPRCVMGTPDPSFRMGR